jgi:hypothetical protein
MAKWTDTLLQLTNEPKTLTNIYAPNGNLTRYFTVQSVKNSEPSRWLSHRDRIGSSILFAPQTSLESLRNKLWATHCLCIHDRTPNLEGGGCLRIMTMTKIFIRCGEKWTETHMPLAGFEPAGSKAAGQWDRLCLPWCDETYWAMHSRTVFDL